MWPSSRVSSLVDGLAVDEDCVSINDEFTSKEPNRKYHLEKNKLILRRHQIFYKEYILKETLTRICRPCGIPAIGNGR